MAKFAVLVNLNKPYVTVGDDTAKIGADPSKGIAVETPVPFKLSVFNLTEAAQAADLFEAIGAEIFNGTFNYGANLKLRAEAVSAARTALTKDPIAEEAKALLKSDLITEAQAEAYITLRREGVSKKEAYARV